MEESAASLQKTIWIASYPKSGNTWVRLFIHNLLQEVGGNAEDDYDINRLSKLTVREAIAAPYQQILGKNPAECFPEDIARARTQVQKALAESRTAPFFVKTHLGVAKINGYPTINFEVTLAAVYVVRNPLDIAVSYAHYADREIDHIIEQMAAPATRSSGCEHFVYEFIGSWSSHVASWMSVLHRPIYFIRYEDMLKGPFRVFGGLARFLRLAPSPEQLNAAIRKSSFSELSKQESEKGFVERPPTAGKFFRAGQADQWRDALTKEQIREVIASHASIMQRCGYLLPNCGADVLPAMSSAPRGNNGTAAHEPSGIVIAASIGA